MTTDKNQIENLLLTYSAALSAADADAAAAAYAPDGVFYPYNLPTATGTDQLLASYRQIFATISLDVTFDIEDVVVDGDVAWATTSSAGKVTIIEPNLTVDEANREVFILTRSASTGGEWKIARYMFNKSEAPAAPGA